MWIETKTVHPLTGGTVTWQVHTRVRFEVSGTHSIWWSPSPLHQKSLPALPNDSAHLIALLEEWASDDSDEQETTFATFANNIDAERRRLGMRTLFNAERDSA
jgi:hypothetical protein